MCDICFQYGAITVNIKKHGKDIESCFQCLRGGK